MEKEKPYINPDLKMGDLASALDTSSHSLSYLLNQYLNQSYYDFINEYRVTQFKKMVADSQYSRYTLTALAELCGFSSRASFFRSFKKSTGVTPNEYIRSIGGTAKEEGTTSRYGFFVTGYGHILSEVAGCRRPRGVCGCIPRVLQRGTGYIHHRPVQAIRIKREQDERDENQTAYERIEE